METRTCNLCNEPKQLNPLNFYKDKVCEKDGFTVRCKMCIAEKKGVKTINKIYDKDKTRLNKLTKLKENRTTCECGVSLRVDSMQRHLSSNYIHRNYLNRK